MKRILVVDDDDGVVRTYAGILTRAGYEVAGCTTFGQAKAAIETDHQSLHGALLDLSLGCRDSGELVPIIRQRYPIAGVALVSGTPKGSRWLEVSPKCDVTLLKPLTCDEIRKLACFLVTCRSGGLTAFAERYGLAQSERRLLEHARARPHATLQEIAVALGLSRATVQDYLQRIFNKTGVRSLREILGILASSR